MTYAPQQFPDAVEIPPGDDGARPGAAARELEEATKDLE
jgi:hypothetical protein